MKYPKPLDLLFAILLGILLAFAIVGFAQSPEASPQDDSRVKRFSELEKRFCNKIYKWSVPRRQNVRTCRGKPENLCISGYCVHPATRRRVARYQCDLSGCSGFLLPKPSE